MSQGTEREYNAFKLIIWDKVKDIREGHTTRIQPIPLSTLLKLAKSIRFNSSNHHFQLQAHQLSVDTCLSQCISKPTICWLQWQVEKFRKTGSILYPKANIKNDEQHSEYNITPQNRNTTIHQPFETGALVFLKDKFINATGRCCILVQAINAYETQLLHT